MTYRRAVLVTGASTGIGAATAARFARAGWEVWAGIRTSQRAAEWAPWDLVQTVQLDVTDGASVDRALAEIAEVRGDRGLDALVNNAGVAHGGPMEFLEVDEWTEQFDVNFIGVIRVTKAALPLMRRAVDPRLVMVGSINSRLGAPLLGPYVASKHALGGLVAVLRREFHPRGPLVTLIEPGAVRTEIWPKAAATADRLITALPAEALDRYGDHLAAQRALLRGGEHGGIAADDVARVIERIVARRRPPARQLVGPDAAVGGALDRVLPDRAMEILTRFAIRRTLSDQARS